MLTMLLRLNYENGIRNSAYASRIRDDGKAVMSKPPDSPAARDSRLSLLRLPGTYELSAPLL